MPSYVISQDELHRFTARLMETQPLMGPRERPDQPGFYHFDWLDRPEDLTLDYVATTIPPKKAFFQPNETLFTFSLANPPELDLVSDVTPFVLAGVHPCDLSGLDALDAAYCHPPAEVRWPADRKLATIIGVDCMPDEYCFCTTMNTFATRTPCDLFLTKISRGYLVEVHTQAGEELLRQADTVEARDEDLRDAEQWREEKVGRIKASFKASLDEFAGILEQGGLTPVWQEVAERCYSCGSCNTTCPTCFCFTITDEFDHTLRSGVRRRSWDSCQLLEFALVAGRHNFRGDRWQRVRHRWQRKFLYLYRTFGRPYCTGCGRCSRACTADINMVEVSNQLIDFARREAQNA
jgi:sulfhydrogenase subunit beta (sulfur reductase)